MTSEHSEWCLGQSICLRLTPPETKQQKHRCERTKDFGGQKNPRNSPGHDQLQGVEYHKKDMQLIMNKPFRLNKRTNFEPKEQVFFQLQKKIDLHFG